MRAQQLEAWTLSAVERCVAGHKVEDNRVELKRDWPEAGQRTARRIAAHANSADGDNILWIIGVDEKARQIQPVVHTELANWWPQVLRWFDGAIPELVNMSVTVPGGQVEALHFATNQAPYVVNTEGGGQVEREIPWREGNATRTAHRHEILRSLVAEASAPSLELIKASITLSTEEGDPKRFRNPGAIRGHMLAFSADIYVSGPSPVTFPSHKQGWRLESSEGTTLELTNVELDGTYRFNGWSQSGGRKREFMGPIEVMAHNELRFHSSGLVSASNQQQLDPDLAAGMRDWTVVNLAVNLPIALTGKVSLLRNVLHHVPGSLDEAERDPNLHPWRQVARFVFDSAVLD